MPILEEGTFLNSETWFVKAHDLEETRPRPGPPLVVAPGADTCRYT